MLKHVIAVSPPPSEIWGETVVLRQVSDFAGPKPWGFVPIRCFLSTRSCDGTRAAKQATGSETRSPVWPMGMGPLEEEVGRRGRKGEASGCVGGSSENPNRGFEIFGPLPLSL
jgi:hypothetical protein